MSLFRLIAIIGIFAVAAMPADANSTFRDKDSKIIIETTNGQEIIHKCGIGTKGTHNHIYGRVSDGKIKARLNCPAGQFRWCKDPTVGFTEWSKLCKATNPWDSSNKAYDEADSKLAIAQNNKAIRDAGIPANPSLVNEIASHELKQIITPQAKAAGDVCACTDKNAKKCEVNGMTGNTAQDFICIIKECNAGYQISQNKLACNFIPTPIKSVVGLDCKCDDQNAEKCFYDDKSVCIIKDCKKDFNNLGNRCAAKTTTDTAPTPPAPEPKPEPEPEPVPPAPEPNPEPEPVPPVPVPADKVELVDISKHNLGDSSRWIGVDGDVNTKRMVVDSVVGVALGAVGGYAVNKLMKSSQLESGFENIQCTISGKEVAGWNDQFTIGGK